MTGLGRCMSSISVCSLPRYCLVILRPKMTVILLGWPIVRGVEQSLAQLVERGPPMKDQIVAEFDLREEEAMLAACLSALSFAEERGEAGQPFLAAARQILGSQGIGQLLETLRCAAAQKSIRALLEIEVLLIHAVGQPVMLIETDPRRERQIREHAKEHANPAPVVDIEVVLHDSEVGDLKVQAVGLDDADCSY